MTSHASDQQPLRLNLDDDQIEVVASLIDHLPPGFAGSHCGPARTLLGWSINNLAVRSGVSSEAILQLELGATLNAVSMQALAFAFEAEGLLFFPGHSPLKGENCRGATRDPGGRHDYHLLE